MKTKTFLSIVLGMIFAVSLYFGADITVNETKAETEPYTVSARTVDEEALTDLSVWVNVASTALTNEFSREADATCNSSFQVMWDTNALYVLLKTDDALVDTWDQIEFAYTNGSENGYFKSVLLPENGVRWTESIGTLMASSTVANFDSDGNRYLLVKNVLTDKSVLVKGGKIRINIIYWAFNGSHGSVCKYSASASASPSEEFTLVGDPASNVEKPAPYTFSARTVDEEALTDLSVWVNVASTALTNEFSREADATCNSSFQVMWDMNALYVLVKTDDALVDTWDQIEFAYTNGSENGYFKASMLPENGTRWTESIGSIMTSSAVANFDSEGNRYLLVKNVLTDNSVLVKGGKIRINIIYWAFNGSHGSVCKYSASASASPSEEFTLVGDPASNVEKPAPYTFSARTADEEELTDLSVWVNVASTALTNEFSREADATCNSSFQVMWDTNALYVLVKTDDALVDTWDQIEFAYTNGSENGYFKSVLLPENGVRWTESIGTLMASSTVANFDSDGNRYLLVKNVLADNSVLVKGGTIRINIIYWAFNGSHGSVCKYSASASASPSEEFTLVGDPAGKTAEEIANEAAADAVVEKINAIPATVTENDEDVITDARAAYDSLTAKQKELIPATSYNKLTDAEQVLISLNYKICALPDWKADITDLSVWEGVASNSLTYEFQRAADYTGKIGVTFQIIWDYTTLYVLVKTDDATVSEADQIEFAYNNGEEPAYFNTSVGGWQSSAGTLMDSTQLKTFTDNNGYRYILTRHIIADKTVLETGNSLSVNVLYRDFTEDTAQLCIYSFSSSASPSVSMKLTGTPDVMSEEEKEAIKQIEDCIDLIVALPLEITLESETAVSAAKTAYDALTDEQKAEISDRLIDALNTAVSRIAELKAEKEKTEADEAAATAVVEKIDAIGEVTVNSKEAIVSARNAYDALTEDQKAYVSEEKLSVLVAAEIDYTSLEASETSASEGTSVDDSEINAEDGCFAGIGIGSMFALVLLAAGAYAAKRRR